MAKLSQKGRDRLVRIMQDERAEQRCTFVQGYNKEAKELTKNLDHNINICEKEIDRLKLEIQIVDESKDQYAAKKEELLTENNLLNFNISYGTCDLGGKPSKLKEFDIETRNMEKEILER